MLAAIGNVIWSPLGPATALYLLACSRDDAAPWTPRSAGIVVALLIAYLSAGVVALVFAGSGLVHAGTAGTAYAAAWFAGERTRLRREQLAELRQRAILAGQQAARERQLAVAEERARIARDPARLRRPRAQRDRGTRRHRPVHRHAAGRRYPGWCRRRLTGLASLDALLAQHAAAGLRVTVTNPVRAGLGPGTSRGHGVIRMRERAALLGGQLTTGPTGDTFRVEARIPHPGRPA